VTVPEVPASTAPAAAAYPLVKGRCPACNGASLFLGSGGYVTCGRLDCPDPSAADDQLHRGRPEPTATEPEEATRVTALYQQWVKAGAPPLSTPIARWWDRRLAELHNAIHPPTDQTTEK
jgi:hypothetical protein